MADSKGSGDTRKGTTDSLGQAINKVKELTPQIQNALNQAKPFLEKIEPYLRAAYPYCHQAKGIALQVYTVLKPYYNHEVGSIAVSLTLLLLGGQFAMTIACVQVFRASGQRLIMKSWNDLCRSFHEAMMNAAKDSDAKELFKVDPGELTVWEFFVGLRDLTIAESEEDKALARRKVLLLMKCIDPNKIWDAVLGLWTGLVAVLATVRSRFVQSITLGANVGKKCVEILFPIVQPRLHEAFPNHRQWVDFFMRAAGGLVGVIISLMLVRVMTAANSSVQGASMLVDQLIDIATRKKLLARKIPSERSRIVICIVAAFGFLVQLWARFSVPWFLKIPLSPILAVEGLLNLLAMRPMF
jgi:hypothetical protein